jgi:hypothetical protein
MLKKCFCMMTHYVEIDIVTYEDKTIDSYLPPSKRGQMYNKHRNTMRAWLPGFRFVKVLMEGGTPSTSLGPKMGMEATSLTQNPEIYGGKG